MHLDCQGRGGGGAHPCPPVSYATTHSRKVPPPKPRVKAKSSLSGRNYFIKVHHQTGVNFEKFTEVKFRDILLTGPGHRDSPGQTYGRSNLNQILNPKSNFRFIHHLTFEVLYFIISQPFSFYTSTTFLWHAVSHSYNVMVSFAFFVFVRHTAHCFLLLVSCMLYVVKKHCPEEVH